MSVAAAASAAGVAAHFCFVSTVCCGASALSDVAARFAGSGDADAAGALGPVVVELGPVELEPEVVALRLLVPFCIIRFVREAASVEACGGDVGSGLCAGVGWHSILGRLF